MTKLLAQTAAPGFKANFFHNYQATISRPISEVFSIIGTSTGAERVTLLSKLANKFELKQADTIAIPASASLEDLHVRILPPSATNDDNNPSVRFLSRQFFEFSETLSILGLMSHNVHLHGALTWDENAKVSLYEARSNTGILVWKLRIFEEVDSNTTKVNETIRGACPSWCKPIVQRTTTAGHT